MSAALYTGGRPLGAGIQDAELSDPVVCDQLLTYRRRVAGNYRPLPPAQIGMLASGPAFVSPKIDGELCFLMRLQGQTLLSSARGRVIAGDVPLLRSVPVIPEGTIIAGELHARVEGRRSRVSDLAALLDSSESEAALKALAFSAFDLLQDSGNAEHGPYGPRLERLRALLPGTGEWSVVPTEVVNTASDVQQRFDAMVNSGQHEGLVIRFDSGLIHKLKPAIHVDAAIVGFTVRADRPGRVRSVLLGLLQDDGQWVLLGPCGELGDDAIRSQLHAQLTASVAQGDVRFASDSGSLYTFVSPTVVAEIVATDLQGHLSDGSAPRSLTARWEGGRWQAGPLTASPRLLGACLERIRADKRPEVGDVRFAQVTPYLGMQSGAVTPAVALPAASMLRREVWTKETKGQVAVRKVLVWRTGKRDIDPAYPAYVVHWTDYSPGRASPLDRDVRPAPDEASAMALADEFIAENIKKGWTRAG